MQVKAIVYAAIVGDITPFDGVSKEEKARLETNAIQQIKTMLGSTSAAGGTGFCPPQVWALFETRMLTLQGAGDQQDSGTRTKAWQCQVDCL